jgi:hypothetical protein
LVEILKFFYAHPGSRIRDGKNSVPGSGIQDAKNFDPGLGIWDGKNSDPGSRIRVNIPDQQNWKFRRQICYFTLLAFYLLLKVKSELASCLMTKGTFKKSL